MKVIYTCDNREQVVKTLNLSNGEQLRIIATKSPHSYVSERPRRAQAVPAAGRSTGGATATASAPVPAGYRAAFDDDRLNPNRGPRTAQGTAQMALVWTNTVPRRLVDRTTGRDVTARYPQYRYPRVPGQGETVSTMSAPTRASVPAASGAATHRFVQAASFGDPANAQRTAQRLAGLGLPVRMGKISRGGKELKVVLAGPFTRQADLKSALGKVRGAGFGDAFYVK